jgi:DNA-directed RNA polymerase subunit RPC12/RpoP
LPNDEPHGPDRPAGLSLARARPHLALEWHGQRNSPLFPADVATFSHRKVWWRCQRRHVWSATVASRARGTGCPYCAGRMVTRATSLGGRHPDLCQHWHPTRNGALSAYEISPGSKRKVWWLCEVGHEWQAQVASRTAGKGCPYCSNRYVAQDRSLAAQRPDLLAQWDGEKNAGIDPFALVPGSNRKVWWKCRKDHRWLATIASRARRESGCPYCAGKRVDSESCLASLHPDLAKQWHPRRNRPLNPTNIGIGSNRRVWWRCDKGHQWQTTVQSRSLGTGCPYCSGRRTTPARSLTKLRPDLLQEWDTSHNPGLDPNNLAASTITPVWWRCREGHLWQAPPGRRARGEGCPYCAGRLTARNRSFAALHPNLLAEVHPERNTALDPWSLAPATNRKIWWRCSLGHQWYARVSARTVGKTGCPTCADTSPKGIPIFDRHPELAEQWDLELNAGTGEELTTGSKVKAWWRCRLKPTHRWQARVQARTRGTGCPYCAHRRPAPETCLAATGPDLASQWHPVLNAELSPTDVLPGSSRRVWWACSAGHSWRAPIRLRSRGTGCPYCSGRLVTPPRSLAAVRPQLVSEWHPRRNLDLGPSDVTARSNRKVGWLCPKGHAWQTNVAHRVGGTGCPKCHQRKRSTTRRRR